MMAKIAVQKLFDLGMHSRRVAGQGNAQACLDAVHHAGPVAHQLIIAAYDPPHPAREIFGVQHMAQPQQLAIAGCHQVARFQRGADFCRVAQHQHHARFHLGISHARQPQIGKAAGARVFQREQRPQRGMILNHLPDPAQHFSFQARLAPIFVDRSPVQPA